MNPTHPQDDIAHGPILEMIRDLCAALLRQGSDLDGNWGNEPSRNVISCVGQKADDMLQQRADSLSCAGGGAGSPTSFLRARGKQSVTFSHLYEIVRCALDRGPTSALSLADIDRVRNEAFEDRGPGLGGEKG